MKKPLLISAALILCATIWAQVPQGISHQAVIRNAQGELVTNQLIGIQVSIIEDSINGKPVYRETHTATTNVHGLVTYVIGEGDPREGSFDEIKWDNWPFFLMTEVDPDYDGDEFNFTIIGTTQFLSVPYALYSGTSADNHWMKEGDDIFTRYTGNVGIGVENPSALLHASGTGTGEGNVLFEGLEKFTNPGDPPASQANTRMLWYPDKSAFRAGRNSLQNWSKDSIGHWSISMGLNATAAGTSSFAVGQNVSSSGPGSIAIGSLSSAKGFAAMAIGMESEAKGAVSIAIGKGLKALSGQEIVVGSFNTEYDPVYSQDWYETDRLFVIGNGYVDFSDEPPYDIIRSNAMTVLKNGNIGIGSENPQAQLHTTGSVRFEGAGTPGPGKVFTSDGEGVGTWQEKVFDLPYSGTYYIDEEAVFQVTNTATSVNSSGIYGISSLHGTGVIGSGSTGVKGLGGTTGVYGESSYDDGFGVHGRVTHTGSGNPYGVFGESLCPTGTGVHGSGPTGVSGFGDTGVKGHGTIIGVFGHSSGENGHGVFGWADSHYGNTYGGYFVNSSSEGKGVYGLATATTGSTYGVFGQNKSTTIGSAAVYGLAEATSGSTSGIYGVNHSSSGRGVFGWAVATTGTTYGVYGLNASSSGRALYGWASASSGTTYGVYGSSSSSQGRGVYGVVYAESGLTYGVYGSSSSSQGRGVYGVVSAESGFTYGVYGSSSSSNGRGVYGVVNAESGFTYGVYGLSTSGQGVYGVSLASTGPTSGVTGVTNSMTGYGVFGQASASDGLNFGVYGVTLSFDDGYAIFSAGRFAATGTKSFQIDHPLDPANKYLNHFCSEGPEPLNVYSGNIITDAKGFATVNLPEYFESINRDFRYQLTIIDDSDDFVLAKVTREVQNNRFIIRTSKPDVKVSWRVEGVRNDNWVKQHGALAEKEKPAEHRGKYLNPEFFGMPKDMGIHFQEDIERPEFLQLQECEKAEPQGIDHQMNQ